ncbi:MAG: aldose epimerase family protein [Verrucomicrobiota bacterium]
MSKSRKSNGTVTHAPFGKTPDGVPVEIYTLRNAKGMEARILTYGGVLQSLLVPDKNGKLGDVVLGFDNLDDYVKLSPHFGAIIGRYGNRIARGRFTLNGVTYTLARNNGPNHLHGGVKSFDKVVWQAAQAEVGPRGPRLKLTYLSKDGEEGYPGNLSVTAIYTVTEDNALEVEFTATTDQDTICNLTHHSYFNLRGHGDVLDHVVDINADRFTPVDSTMIPTGELRPVAGTPFDFRKPASIGARINSHDEQIKLGNGYDHNWVLNHKPGQLALAARAADPETGRVMELWTTAPGLQFYTANYLANLTGKGGQLYHARGAFCFEPEAFPDSPNHPNFPTTELKPGQTFESKMVFKFTIE